MTSEIESARKRLTKRKAAVKAAQRARDATARTLRRLRRRQKGAWMPGAERDPAKSIGPCTAGLRGGVIHTTEGSDFLTMARVLHAAGTEPHFLVGLDNGKLRIRQFRPLWDAATALEHPAGTPETNRKFAVQIEVCAFAAKPDWPVALREGVAEVMAYAHAHGVPLKCTVTFTGAAGVKRMSGQAFLDYHAWCGHQHVPNQPTGHWDPGKIDIDDLLRRASKKT